MPKLAIVRLEQLPPNGLVELVAESKASGFRFLRRLIDEWESGHNRFTRPGETLFAAIRGRRVVGVCGLNVNPYTTSARIGRVRHLYVLSDFRRLGIGRQLVGAIVAAAQDRFDLLRLRTDSEVASRFYEALGFQPRDNVPDSTHILDLASAAFIRNHAHYPTTASLAHHSPIPHPCARESGPWRL